MSFTVVSGGAPLADVCVVVSSVTPGGCPAIHYGTQANGVVRVGTIGATSPASIWFLYPNKSMVHIAATGNTTQTITMP